MTGELRVYVAGASAEPFRVRAAMESLRAAGLYVSDWLSRWRSLDELTREERREAGLWCVSEIESADVVLVLAPSHRSDSLVELGYALCCVHTRGHMRVVVSGRVVERGIFGALAHEEHREDEAAVASVIAWARKTSS